MMRRLFTIEVSVECHNDTKVLEVMDSLKRWLASSEKTPWAIVPVLVRVDRGDIVG